MKKTALFLVVMLVVSIFAFSSCDLLQKIPVIGDLINKPCEEHVDANGDYICDKCEAEIEKNDTPPCEHKDENKDHNCDLCEEKLGDCEAAAGSHNCSVCGNKLSDCAAAEGSHNCSVCDKKLSDCSAAEGSHNCSVCGEKVSDCAAAEGSHNCSVCDKKLSDCAAAEKSHNCGVCGEKLSDCVDADNDWSCDICGEEKLPDNMERVNHSLNVSDLETGTAAADIISGKFTVVAGTEIRSRTRNFEGVEYTKSVKLGSSSSMIKVDVTGSGKLTLIFDNGSSGVTTQKIKITDPAGNSKEIEFDGTLKPLSMDFDVTEGVWTIARVSGTVDVYALSLSCVVEKSEENGFEIVANGKVDYISGEDFDYSKLVLNSTYANGKTEPLDISAVTVDSSAFNKNAAGTYTITVSYKDYAPKTYSVNVYAPESLRLGFDSVEKLAQNSSAGNGVYFNHSFREVYGIGDSLDLAGLSVTVICANSDGAKKEFLVSLDDVTVSGFESETAGAKTVTVAYGDISANAVVYVVDAEPSIVGGIYLTMVDSKYSGEIGAVVSNYNMFTTIQQALDFLADADANSKKFIQLSGEKYWEKLEITIPNLIINGASDGSSIIEWDSLYGIVDAGGFTHTTDSTATVAIRDGAYNCTIENVTISNAYNSKAYFDEKLGVDYPEHRALALLVQADMFVMQGGKLLGYQDTVELFTGRQYFKGVEIHGYTDFIFGTNNTTLFEDCVIHTIYSGKTNGGYITAFKGSNKGDADAITYGAIFYHCDFTAAEGVPENLTAIGRPWGAYAAVATIECNLGAHISTAGSTGVSANERYVTMNAKPTDATVQYVEYNNTGAGAITEAVAGMRFLTAEEAANYVDFKVIFGKINGKVSYDDAWDPTSTEVKVDDRTYYYFDQGSSSTGTSNTFDTTTTIAKGTTLEWNGILISAENGNVAWNQNANALNMKQGAFIKFSVPAGTEVTVKAFSGYQYFTINGVGTAAATLSQYFAEETEVVVMSVGDLYIYSITINPNEEAPAAPTLNEIKASGMNTNYNVGEELSYEGLEIKAYYSDNSVVTVTDYTTDASAVVNSAAGSYDVVFSFGGKTASVTVIYEDPNAAPEITKNTVLDFKNAAGYDAVVANKRVTLEGSFRANGAEYQIQGTISFPVKAGTRVIVNPYANSQYVSYTIGAAGAEGLATLTEAYTFVATEDCTVVYTGLSNNYLVSIEIVCPMDEGTYVFGGSTAEGDFTGILSSTENLVVEGTCKTHNGGAQLGQDSKISFIAPAFSTVTIKGYDTSYGQLEVYAGSELIAMDSNACYVFSTAAPVYVTIKAVNVGTEDSPVWNKSYITYINVDLPTILDETTDVTFGSEGNYKDSGIDFSGIQIGDNGGSNSQIKNGSFSFIVKAGATVTVNGYSGYTSYTFSDGNMTTEEITDTTYVYVAEADALITITPVSGNNYFYSFSIVYPVVFEENTTIDLSATGAAIQGATGIYEGLSVDATKGKFADNGGGWTQVNAGTVISLNVLEGAEVSISAYNSADNFAIEIVDGVCTITCNANDYLNAITVKYKVVYDEATTIDLSATGANIQKTTGTYEGLEIDATNGKFADNGGGWVQVNTGTIIRFNVAEGASVSVSAYTSADNYTIAIADGVCTITCVGNDYLKAIAIAY